MIVDAISKLIDGQNLSQDEATQVFNQIMNGEATDAQIGAYLIAQRMTGETKAEISGAATVMRQKATPIPVQAKDCIDTCGTGGDKSGTFNISTVSAIVAAAAGAPVAKHGNRSISSNCGSADVLKDLGINIEIGPKEVAECVDSVGIGFLFAPLLHGAMKYAIGPRREIAQRSIFNVLGPLTNPAGAKRQVMGVFDSKLTETLAGVLGDLGSTHVMVVAGADGLDEITLCDATKVSEFKDGKLKTYTITPEDFGFQRADLEHLKGGTPKENAQILRDILSGQTGAPRDVVLLNAGAAIYVAGITNSHQEGIEEAKKVIDSGKALEVLEALIKKSNSF